MAIYRSTYERRKVTRNCISYTRATIMTHPFTSTSSLPLKKTDVSQRRQMLFFDKNWLLVGYFVPLCFTVSPRVSSIPSSANLSPRFYPPIFSPPISFLFHPFHDQKKNDGNPRSVERFGSIAFPFHQVFFLSFKRVDSSYPKILSPTRDPSYYPIFSLFDPSSLFSAS